MRYIFMLNTGITYGEAHPIYKQDISKEIAKESGQQFFRETISSPFKFVGADFEKIDSVAFETKFRLEIWQRLTDDPQEDTLYWAGVFYKTDGKWDYDNSIVEVKVAVDDKYTEILANWEKEINLVEVSPKRTEVKIDKRPAIQLYIYGRGELDNYVGGTSWVQGVEQSDATVGELLDTYYFTKNDPYFTSEATGTGVFPLGAVGTYMGYVNDILVGTAISGEIETFSMNVSDTVVGSQTLKRIRIYHGSRLMFEGTATGSSETVVTVSAISGSGAVGTMIVSLPVRTDVYQRVITNKYLSPTQSPEIPSEDIVANNRNFKYIIAITNVGVTFSTRASVTPTKYGRRPDGLYYLPPNDWSTDYYPMARGEWNYGSLWFSYPDGWPDVEPFFRDEYSIRDAFPLHEVLNELVRRTDSQLRFEDYADSDEFSKTLNQIGELFVTPKSNILAGQYTLAAQKAPATLKMFLDMLRDVYQIYWFIEGGKLRLENIAWFKNGGSFNKNFAEIGADLTLMQNSRNGKSWDYASEKIEFAKTEMPERFEFSWADDVSAAFEGSPIEVKSLFVERGKVENVAVSNFTTDIDYMLLTPETVSWDGFALFRADKWGPVGAPWTYKIPYASPGQGYSNLQNGDMSWTAIHKRWWLADLPAKKMIVNEELIDPDGPYFGIQRKRKQKVSFPCGINDPDPMKLINTSYGVGQIEKINVSLHNRIAKVDLVYDTEQ